MVNPLKRRVLEETALCMVKPAFTHVKREGKKYEVPYTQG
jgi:hypothetical protein